MRDKVHNNSQLLMKRCGAPRKLWKDTGHPSTGESDTIMRALLLVAIAWSACDALLLGPAYATQRAPAYRAHVRLEEGGAPAPTAAASTFTADEIAALKEARCHAASVFSGLWLT